MDKQASAMVRFGAKLGFGFHCNHHQDVEQNDDRTGETVHDDSDD